MDKLQLLTDNPLGIGNPIEYDGLDFDKYANVLGQVAIDTPGPFTIGVFGEWGTGKTSLLQMIKNDLELKDQGKHDIITVWFNAWKYENEEMPIIPLIATIVNEVENSKNFKEKLKDRSKTLLKGLKAVVYGLSLKTKINIPTIAEIEGSFTTKEVFERWDQEHANPILDKSIYYDAFKLLSNIKLLTNTRIIVFIDDLDRCMPNKAIKLLESIKLVLSQKGFIYYLGVSRRVLEGYLEHKYANDFGITNFKGQSYLDKIIQLPFSIPTHKDRMVEFWEEIIKRLPQKDRRTFKELSQIIEFASGSIPRNVIRFINNLLVDRAIYRAIVSDGNIPLSFFAISRSIQQRWPLIYNAIAVQKTACDKIVNWVNAKDQVIDLSEIKEDHYLNIAKLINSELELKGLLESKFGMEWLKNHAIRKETFDFYIEQSRESDNRSDNKSSTNSAINILNLIDEVKYDEFVEELFSQFANLDKNNIFEVKIYKMPPRTDPSDDLKQYYYRLNKYRVQNFTIIISNQNQIKYLIKVIHLLEKKGTIIICDEDIDPIYIKTIKDAGYFILSVSFYGEEGHLIEPKVEDLANLIYEKCSITVATKSLDSSSSSVEEWIRQDQYEHLLNK